MKPITLTAFKVCVLLILITGVSGCLTLSKFFDPNKNVLTKKVVERDKPNLSETAGREPDVDPDSDELQEEPDYPPKKSADNAGTEGNTATETDDNADTNTNSGQADPNTEQTAKSPVGKWQATENGQTAVFEFTEAGKFVVYMDNEPVGEPVSYTVAGDNTVELRKDGKIVKVKCEVSADGKTMRFTGEDGKTLNLTRVN